MTPASTKEGRPPSALWTMTLPTKGLKIIPPTAASEKQIPMAVPYADGTSY